MDASVSEMFKLETAEQGTRQFVELGAAFLLSALIGLERESRRKSAGLRTYTIVGTTAALILLVSKYGFMDVITESRIVLDPSRVAAQIVTGIGFIGAGLIDPKTEMDAVNVLLRHCVDGFMIAPKGSSDGLLRELLGRLPIPVVAFERPIADSAVPSVLADNYAGAQLATLHLIKHGCKRIVCLTGESNLYTIQERLRRYRDAVEPAGLECLIDSSIGDFDSAELALEKLFGHSKPLDGIFTLKNSVTIETFAVLQKHNILIPDVVALLGYDDF